MPRAPARLKGASEVSREHEPEWQVDSLTGIKSLELQACKPSSGLPCACTCLFPMNQVRLQAAAVSELRQRLNAFKEAQREDAEESAGGPQGKRPPPHSTPYLTDVPATELPPPPLSRQALSLAAFSSSARSCRLHAPSFLKDTCQNASCFLHDYADGGETSQRHASISPRALRTWRQGSFQKAGSYGFIAFRYQL